MTYEYIINPVTNRKVSIYSKKGMSIIKNYLNQSGGQTGGVNCSQRRKTKEPFCEDEPDCEWRDGRCIGRGRGRSKSPSRGSSRSKSPSRRGRGRPSHAAIKSSADEYYGEYSDTTSSVDSTIEDLTHMSLRRKKYRNCSSIERGDVRTCLTSREKEGKNRGKPCFYDREKRSCRTGVKDELREKRRDSAEAGLKSRRRRGAMRAAFLEAAEREQHRQGTHYEDEEYFPSHNV